MTPFRHILLAALLLIAAAGSAGAVEPVPRPHWTLYFDSPLYLRLADSVLNRTRNELARMLLDTLDYRPDIYVVGSNKEFGDLVEGRFPDWGAAVAIPVKGRIVIKSPDKFNIGKPLSQLLAHEYSHLVMAERTGFYRAPRWFDEGVAQMVSIEWTWSENLAMSKAAVLGQFIPLQEIELLNRFGEAKAQVAYAESNVAVKFFYDTYGVEMVNEFLNTIRDGGSMDEAFVASTGSDYAGFESEFQDWWKKRYNLITLLADTMWLWFALAIVVVIGAFLKYRKRRQYYKKWDREERLQSTDFDYGDPDHPEEVDDDEPWRH